MHAWSAAPAQKIAPLLPFKSMQVSAVRQVSSPNGFAIERSPVLARDAVKGGFQCSLEAEKNYIPSSDRLRKEYAYVLLKEYGMYVTDRVDNNSNLPLPCDLFPHSKKNESP
jgi:hypothetical protein